MFRTLVLFLFFSNAAIAQQLSDLRLQWSGDLRYRIAKLKEDIDEERNFQQLRARLGMKTDFDEDLSLVFRLATGTSAISTNQTLGDSKDPGMSRRSFGRFLLQARRLVHSAFLRGFAIGFCPWDFHGFRFCRGRHSSKGLCADSAEAAQKIRLSGAHSVLE